MDLDDPGGSLLERERATTEIKAAFERARAGAPAVLVIEGAAGEGKSALLAAARERANGIALRAVDDAHTLAPGRLRGLISGDRPGVTIVAFRPAEPGADEAGLDELRTTFGVRRVTLGPLGADSVAELVRRHQLGADDELCGWVHDVTGGNPLYVSELLAGDPRRDHLPAVGDRVLRRAAALGDGARALVTAIAVLGDGERLEMAARVAGIPDERASEIGHRLRRMGILAGEDPAAFAQPIVRASIYHGLTDRDRDAAHGRAVTALRAANRSEPDLGQHLAARIPAGSSEIATGLAAAAAHAPESGEAIRWLRRAVQENAVEPPRAELLQRLGQVELVARDAAAVGHLREALELTSDPVARAVMGIDLGEILAHVGRWEEMMAVMSLVELDVAAASEEIQVRWASVIAVATAHDAARVHVFDRDRERFEALSHGPSWSAHAMAALLASVSAQRGEPPAYAIATAERAVADGVLLSEQGGGGWAAPHLVGAFIITDHHERALALLHSVEHASRQAGAVTGLMLAAAYRGWLATRRGDLLAAEIGLRRALKLIPDEALQMAAATFYFVVSDALIERPVMRDLGPPIEALTLEPAFAETWSGAMHLWARGRLRLAQRDHAGGLADLRAVARIAQALRVGPSMAPWRSELALALGPGDREEALALAAAELEHARTGTLARPEGIALRALGRLTGGPEGIELLRQAVSVLEGSTARLELARSLIALGAALRREGKLSEARVPLEAGLELADACGALRLATTARDEVAAAAGRPARSTAADRLLTPSELRVARLVVDGASNREVARDLYVSMKTVETHLSHVYAKLGLAGRGARSGLATALAPYLPESG